MINTGDPVQAFDRWGHVYYGVIGFNRSKPSNGSIFAARYDWAAPMTSPDYRWTALVARGAPALSGKFEDKVQLEVDRGVASPYAGSLARPWGNVYVCWAQFVGNSGNNGVYIARSTDGGRTYSQPQKISEGVHGSQFCDIAVTSNGTVYVVWRSFEGRGKNQVNGVVVAKSTDGGKTFTKPQVVTEFIPWDVGDLAGVPAEERETAMEEACEQGDGIECGESENESGPEREQTPTRDCGDGPFVCESGYVFFREDSQTRITADPTDTARPQAAYIVYNATVPGTETPTGTSYGTVEPGIGSQGQLYLAKTLDGSSWTTGVRVTPGQAKGHQFFPDVDANAGSLHVVWQDSRNDTATGPPSTPSGGDYRTVPIANRWVSSNPPGASRWASASGSRRTTRSRRTSGSASPPSRSRRGRRCPSTSSSATATSRSSGTTTRSRRSVAPSSWTGRISAIRSRRSPGPTRGTRSTGRTGFDVLQCRTATASGFTADGCPNAGGSIERHLRVRVRLRPDRPTEGPAICRSLRFSALGSRRSERYDRLHGSHRRQTRRRPARGAQGPARLGP